MLSSLQDAVFRADTLTRMRVGIKNSKVGRAIVAAAVTLVGCAGILVWVMQLWRADWAVPFAYDKDALLCGMLAKTMTENGWYLHNALLGAPQGLAYYDYPFGDLLHFALLRVLALIVPQFGFVMNAFFVLSFPLTALVSLFVLRRLEMSWPCAIVGALLYTFLPYHFLRGEPHLFLSMYWIVPPAILVMAWLGEDIAPARVRARLLVSVTVCVLLGLTGYYYAYFAAVLFLAAGAEGTVRHQRAAPLVAASLLAAVVVLTCALTTLPSLQYWHTHGKNSQVAQRDPSEADFYGLKIAQLLLPVTGHRLPAQAQMKDNYNNSMLLINENDDSTLGVIGSLGFLLLLGGLILRGSGLFSPLLERLATLNLCAILLGTIGGLGSLVALLVLPQIRSYNRISIFIAFFALYAVLGFFDQWYRQSAGRPRARALCLGILAALLAFGVFDQTSASFVPHYAQIGRQFTDDTHFVGQIEAVVPPHASIFQLPPVLFPENGATGRMTDYQQFRGYLHSQTLRWSYGGMKGRAASLWPQGYCDDVPQRVRALYADGFRGVWVDRDGYGDHGVRITEQLTSLMHEPPIASADGRLLFFPLTNPLPGPPAVKGNAL